MALSVSMDLETVNCLFFSCQDIRECCGPQAVLLELNSTVKEKFNQLRLRIQVTLHSTSNINVRATVTGPNYENNDIQNTSGFQNQRYFRLSRFCQYIYLNN